MNKENVVNMPEPKRKPQKNPKDKSVKRIVFPRNITAETFAKTILDAAGVDDDGNPIKSGESTNRDEKENEQH
jgi:hypothetical protein